MVDIARPDTTLEAPSGPDAGTAPPAFAVSVAPDKLAVLVSIADPHDDLDDAAGRIATALHGEQIAAVPDHAELCRRLAGACAPGEHLVDHPLITGRAAVPPRHGRLDWTDDFFADGFVMDEERDVVDYRERREKRAVDAGQVLAVLTAPREGEPGLDVFGNKIPVEKAHKERLRAGKGVHTEDQGEDAVRFVAEISGRLRLCDGTVAIDEVFTIKGNVGLETGNVRHPGTVIVLGDIEAGCHVETEGDLLVKGLVEPSMIVCGGNLTVGGGIVGDPDHRISVAGDVQARYLNEVVLDAGGDLRIHSQIDHSRIRTRGRIDIPQGRIAGGRVQAYRGIETGWAGAHGATVTVLVAGVDWRYEEEIASRREKTSRLQDARRHFQTAVTRYAPRLDCLTDEDRATLQSLREKIAQIDAALQAESQRQLQQGQLTAREGVREVRALKGICPGTVFQLGNLKDRVVKTIEKPRLVALRRDRVQVLPLNEEMI